MFIGVNEKLERAEYFLNNIKDLAEEAVGIHAVQKRKELRANLDGFFFEVVSAKDFFLQGINDHYSLGLRKQEATDIPKLKRCLESRSKLEALEIVASIGTKLDTKNTWLWKLNNYRNSATHRELLRFWHITEGPTVKVKEGEEPVFQVTLDPETKIPTLLQRKDAPNEKDKFIDTRTYLLKDPEDSSQGNADIEVIPYCEQSLERMREFLDSLYCQFKI